MDQISAISPDSIPVSNYGWQVTQRIQYAVAQVANTHAGSPKDQVAEVLSERIRHMGVSPNARDVQRLAEAIARLPKPA